MRGAACQVDLVRRGTLFRKQAWVLALQQLILLSQTKTFVAMFENGRELCRASAGKSVPSSFPEPRNAGTYSSIFDCPSNDLRVFLFQCMA